MKEFFSIEKPYEFNIYDLTACITIFNVLFKIMGIWWTPILGLINCSICIGYAIKTRSFINTYISQLALIIMNIYFLTL